LSRGPARHPPPFPTRRSSDLGAEGAERRELAGPLRDRDRQGVEDHERADEEGDPAEPEQEDADEVQEAGDVLLVGLRLLLAGLQDRKSTRLNSSHQIISYAVF